MINSITIRKYGLTALVTMLSILLMGQTKKEDPNNQILKKSTYTVSYNETCECANYVAYNVCGDSLDIRKFVRADDFREDKEVKTKSALPSDYQRSGYDKGHLLPASDRDYNEKYLSETFLMSNMTPQLPDFNRKIWKRLEMHERDLAKKYKNIYVVTGPLLDSIDSHIGKNEVCVARSFFKVIKYGKKTECYIIPQNAPSNADLKLYLVDIKAIKARVRVKLPSL